MKPKLHFTNRPESDGIPHLLPMFKWVIAALWITSLLSQATGATLSSTVPQSGVNDNAFEWQLTSLSNPFDFTGQPFGSLTGIDEISITLSLQDGDTFEGDIDFDSLTLILDGIDTGLFLNGFGLPGDPPEEDSLVVTLTITGVPENAAAILAALQADGQLVATIRDRHTSHAPFGTNPNGIWVREDFDTTLVIAQCEDADGDGVCGEADDCPNSDLSPTVVIQGCDSGVPNSSLGAGCFISDLINEAAIGATNHGSFVSAISQFTNLLKKSGIITGRQKAAIERCASQSSIGE